MLELPNPFADESGVICLLEADNCERAKVIAQILDGSYDKPFVIDDGAMRSLYFSRELTQSAMRLGDPYALDFRYTQKMMSVLLFVHQPQHILLLGFGGGSLAKYCYRHLPLARITALEIDARVLAFREQFLVPPDDARLRVLQADAAAYLRQRDTQADVVMMDAFDRDGFSASVTTRTFYRDVRNALTAQGVMVANMVGAKATRAEHLKMIADVFSGNVIVLPVVDDGNYLVFAFRDAGFEPRWRWIESQAAAMQKRYGLDFPAFAAKLKRERKDGYLQRTLHQADD